MDVIHQRVREAHFGSVNGTIASALDDGKEVMILGIEDNALDGSLHGSSISYRFPRFRGTIDTVACPTLRLSTAPDMFASAM